MLFTVRLCTQIPKTLSTVLLLSAVSTVIRYFKSCWICWDHWKNTRCWRCFVKICVTNLMHSCARETFDNKFVRLWDIRLSILFFGYITLPLKPHCIMARFLSVGILDFYSTMSRTVWAAIYLCRSCEPPTWMTFNRWPKVVQFRPKQLHLESLNQIENLRDVYGGFLLVPYV